MTLKIIILILLIESTIKNLKIQICVKLILLKHSSINIRKFSYHNYSSLKLYNDGQIEKEKTFGKLYITYTAIILI